MNPSDSRPLESQGITAPADASPQEAMFLPRGQAPVGTGPRSGWTLPPHLREQIPRRLRNIALLYSGAFFLSDLAPAILMGHVAQSFQVAADWVPPIASMLIGLAIAALASSPAVPWRTKLWLGLLFEILGSYGIAITMYSHAEQFRDTTIVFYALSPSWVAVWMLVYSIVVPAPPGRALLALLASASAPAVLIGTSMQRAGLTHVFTPETFFYTHVFPYLIVVGLAYACARIMFTLGADVSRARELGSYRLIERLGQGGMGEVWRASHQLLAREAAVKFIRPESMHGVTATEANTIVRRFELEARTTASLSSAHTVELYDFGIAEDGTFYSIMELLDGLDLDRLVRRFGPLPPARVVYLLAQACESLEEAHGKGLIHRDVKPANLYVCRSGVRRDFIKVLDFGLVAHRQPAAAPDPRLTQPEQVFGTPAFMPPEVALGRELDGRSDLYALGCVAYWLLTGRQVFTGATALEVIMNHVKAEPEPPSRHAPGGVPPELEAVILACLEKDPDRRPRDARELARRLRAVPLEDPWDESRASAWWAAH